MAFNNDIDIENNVSEIYKATSISEYYSLIADLPVKFINNVILKKYFKNTYSKSEQKDNTKNNKVNYEDLLAIYDVEQTLRDFSFVSSSDKNSSTSYYFLMNNNYTAENTSAVLCDFNSLIKFLLQNVNLHLARGDTSDIIFNNINKQVLKFCLL